MKTRQWRTGLRGYLGIAGFALVLLPLAWFAPAVGALVLAAVAIVAALLLHRRASELAASHEKLSGEIDVLSRHLLKVEALATAAAARARPAVLPPDASPAVGDRTLAASVEEVTAEIGLLSGIVRELASVVSTHDGEIARLQKADEQPDAKAEPKPSLPVREPDALVGERSAPPHRPLPLRERPSPPTAPEPTREAASEAALVEAFDGTGLEVWLQPVVSLPQRKVVSYEALARLRIGSGEAAQHLAPDAFMPVLERHGRTTALDRRMLKSAAIIARRLQDRGSRTAVAYALSPLSLYEPDFLRSLGGLVGGAIGDGADPDGRLAVALPQASWRGLDREQKTVLGELRGRVGFILDRPADLRFEAAALAALGIGQVKVPAALLLRPGTGAQPDIAVEDLVAALARSGIGLAACDVEREADVPDLIDLDVPLAQGAVFAAARAVRTEVLASPPHASAEPASPPDPEPPPQRRAFRDFLRRAV